MNNEIYNEKQKGFLIIVNIIVLCVVMYASANLTLNFFGNIGEGDVRDSNWLLGLANEISKVFLPLCFGIALNKSRYVLATIILVMTVITVYISYMASQGLDLNVANQQILEGSNKSELVQFKSEILALKQKTEEEKQNRISVLQKEKDSLPSDYITRKRQIQNKIDEITNEYNAKIDDTENKILDYNSKIENYKVDATLTTNGYHALAKSMGKTVDSIVNFKNIAQEALCLLLSMTLGLLLGNTSFKINDFLNKFKKKAKNKIIEKENVIENLLSKDTVVAKCEVKNNNKYRNIKLKSIKNFGCIDKESVAKYLAIAETTRKENNEIAGIVALSKMSKITESKGKSITGYLKYLGIIESTNRKTYLVKNEKEYKKILEIS